MTKRTDNTILLGYTVGSAEPVHVPLGHLVVFGQTQQAGKTTALEALIARAATRAVAFVTKRGEGGFHGGRVIPPYLVEKTDWQSVQAILESTLQAKQDFKQAWIIRACEGAKTLADVQANTKRLLEGSKRGMDRDMYYVLDHYFDVVIPQLRKLPRAPTVDLGAGLNVVALDGYSPELQALVIRSTIEWVHQKEHGVITVIPEAWRFLPQGRRSPVRLAAEELVREGAALKNFVWIDSQDIAGVDKLPLRAAKTWLIGVQREPNELRRNLASIPAGFEKPKLHDVATLEVGQFFACFGRSAIKTYVCPAWMERADAMAIARGELDVGAVSAPRQAARAAVKPTERKELTVTESEARELREENDRLRHELAELRRRVELPPAREKTTRPPASDPASAPPPASFNGDVEALYQNFKSRLAAEAPAVLRLLAVEPELRVEVERYTVEADGASVLGRVARLLKAGHFDNGASFSGTRAELRRTGPDVNNNSLSQALKKLTTMGFLTNEADGYRAVKSMKVSVVEKKG